MTRLTLSRVSSETSPRPLSTRETVAIETPAWSAIWRMLLRWDVPCAIPRIEARSGTFRNQNPYFSNHFAGKPLDFSATNLLTLPETFTEMLSTARTLREKGTTDETQDSVVSLDRRRRSCRLRRVSGRSQRVDTGGHGQPRQDRGRPQVPRHDGLRRPHVYQELQPLHRDRAAERLVRPGGVLRAPDHHGRRWPQARSVARPKLEVEQRQQDAHNEPRPQCEVVGRPEAHLVRRRLQLPGRTPGQAHGPGRPDRPRQRDRLRQGERPVQGRHQAEGARLAVHLCNDEPGVRRAATRLVEG